MARVYSKVSFRSNIRTDDFGSIKKLGHSENFLAEMSYLYLRTRPG